ncbi:MAG: class I SAM-dependent methyltransferase [Candidatus Bathyarchaeota archaeon]|nr:class I SAM-dependent methyltransferase [Candidatus Bathyarchaeota archaeon]
MTSQKNFPDRQYTYVFHSPGIEPWICGLLKNRNIKNVLDLGCGVGSFGFLIKNYVAPQAELVGIEISPEKIEKLKNFNIYNELIVADVTAVNFSREFDAILLIEVFHSLANLDAFLLTVEKKLSKSGIIIISGPANHAILRLFKERNYEVYEYFLRGLFLRNVKSGEIVVMWRESIHLKILGYFISAVRRVTGKDSAYIIAFKSSDQK